MAIYHSHRVRTYTAGLFSDTIRDMLKLKNAKSIGEVVTNLTKGGVYAYASYWARSRNPVIAKYAALTRSAALIIGELLEGITNSTLGKVVEDMESMEKFFNNNSHIQVRENIRVKGEQTIIISAEIHAIGDGQNWIIP